MKKFFALFIAVVLSVFIFVSCNNSNDSAKEEDSSDSEEKVQVSNDSEVKKDDEEDLEKSVEPSDGEMDGTTYKNEFFDNLEVEIPKDWYIASEEEISKAQGVGNDVISENNEELAEELEAAADANAQYYFMAMKHPLGYAEGTNPNIICMSEKFDSSQTNVESSEDYLNAVKATLKQTGLEYTFSDVDTIDIGGKEFTKFEMSYDIQGIEISQIYYVSIFDEYAFSIITSSYSEEEKAEVNDIVLNGISFGE